MPEVRQPHGQVVRIQRFFLVGIERAVGELEGKIVDIEVELMKFSRSVPLAYTDSMALTDFFDYAEILHLALNREKQESGNGLGESMESVIERSVPGGLRGLGVPGLG